MGLNLGRAWMLACVWFFCFVWVAWWFVSCEPRGQLKYVDMFPTYMQSRFFRTDAKDGSASIFQALPLIAIALNAFGLVGFRLKRQQVYAAKKKTSDDDYAHGHGRPSLLKSLATYPLWVNRNPLGVLTAAEALFILGVLFVVSYNFGRMDSLRFQELEGTIKNNKSLLSWSKLDSIAYNMARAAIIPFSLLWIPVSRGSPLLRLISIPYEQAVKYHIWLATLTIFMLSIHSIGFMIYLIGVNQASQILQWDVRGESCAIVAGLVAFVAGILMWLTSLPCFRRRFYETFFGFHHLYIVFFVFWLYHASWTIHFVSIPVMLFMVDRFLRMLQSSQDVDVLSATILESGAMDIKLATQNNQVQGGYCALSTWYLRFPSLPKFSKFEWHSFSVVSTPHEEKQELSIIIKPLGGWTKSLQDQLRESAALRDSTCTSCSCPFSFKARVEGPYGHETAFYLKYHSLVMVGVGIGVTPLVAILKDILHRQRLGFKELPSRIEVYHCVRKLQDLCILNGLDPKNILEGQESRPKIRVHVYVTSPHFRDYANMEATLEGRGEIQGGQGPIMDLSTYGIKGIDSCVALNGRVNSKDETPQTIGTIGTKGNPMWLSSTTFASVMGFYILWGFSNLWVVKKYASEVPNYTRVHLVLGSMVLGCLLFGGSVVAIWWHRSRLSGKAYSKANCNGDDHELLQLHEISTTSHDDNRALGQLRVYDYVDEESAAAAADRIQDSPWNGTLHLRCRPDWEDTFMGLAKDFDGQSVGVLVSGPDGLQKDVARECKRHTNLFNRSPSSTSFHYHSISFEL